MELELGLKITKTGRHDHASTDLRITKDRSSPLFFSTETETMFILKAHLQGFQREMIKIGINKDGSEIEIKGEKPVEEMVMVGCKMSRKEREVEGFRRIFRIPKGVVLDQIKARFRDEEVAILTISMPKSAHGLQGVGLEEVPERSHAIEALKPPESAQAELQRMAEAEKEGAAKISSQIGYHEKEAHLAETAAKPETAIEEKMEAKPGRELDGTEPPSSEETPRKELGHLNREEVSNDHGPESAESKRGDQGEVIESPYEHETSRAVGELPQGESQKVKNGTDVQGQMNPAAELKLEQMTTIGHTGRDNRSEGTYEKDVSGIGNQRQAEATEHEEEKPEVPDKKGEASRPKAQEKHNSSMKLIMSSAFLVSFVVFVVGIIKARKR